MLNKISKLVLITLIFLLLTNISIFCETENDPAPVELQEEMIESSSETRYTDEEFSNLSDDEKRYIYFNEPQQLPENFNPELYMDIFYPKTEDAEI